MSKFFKYLFIALGSLILCTIIGATVWWNTKTDKGKSDFFANTQDFETAIKYDQTNSDVLMERSVDFNKAGDFRQGFQYLDRAVELDPEKHLGYRGWIRLRKMRDFDKALMDFDRLDSLTPNVVDAPWGEDINFLRGECHFGNKNYPKAIEFFTQSVENQGEDWVDIQTFVYLGLCEYKLNNFDKAVSEFKRALSQSENICEAHFGLARTYQKLGDMESAKFHIQKAEDNIIYKRDDYYNEYLNEIYLSEIQEFKQHAGE